MPTRSCLTLILAIALSAPAAADGPARTELISDFSWSERGEDFGGFSAIQITDDGDGFIALTDKGFAATATLTREGLEATDAQLTGWTMLKMPDGGELRRYFTDSEGIAMAPDGLIYVSFEGEHRVWCYDILGGSAVALPKHPDFDGLQLNSGMEGLAVDANGWLYAVPERSGRLDRPFPVYRFANGEWSIPFTLPRRDAYLPVSLDFGPDGRLYLLERELRGLFFTSRLRRFTVTGDSVGDEEVLLTTTPGTHSNLEGLSVWQDAEGMLRATMIADDNLRSFLPTEIIEYRIH